MTAVAGPPAASDEARTTTPQALLARADGLELLGEVHGSGYKEGAALARRSDGQMVQLGPLMYALLECLDGRRDRDELATCMSAHLGRSVDPEHINALAGRLAQQGLLGGSEHKAPPRSNPLLALRWKVLVTNPAITKRLTRPFTPFFLRLVTCVVIAAFLGVVWFVLFHKGVASATAQAFHKPELLLLVFGLAVASAGFHELGHASACRYGGGTPGGIGMGLYMVWPAFYTDVTDAYRLPKRDRLRVDLGGLYFNAVVAVATMAAWLAFRVDALLLLIGLQLLQMVKQLSPIIRSDGYHILADATGVPDLYQHMGPTLRRLLPGHRHEPSALTGKARALVTAWVLIVVPVLLSLSLTAVLLFPKLVTTAWGSGEHIATGMPHELSSGQIAALLASLLQLFALVLPVFGTVLMTQKMVRSYGGKARAWSAGRPVRHGVLAIATAMLLAGLAWAWWPSGQYQPVRGNEGGTLASMGHLLAAPAAAARPAPQPAPVQLAPGKHLAIAMIPQGGATKQHPALFVIKGGHGQKPVVILSPTAPDPRHAPHLQSGSSTSASSPTTSSPAPASSAPVPASGSTASTAPVPATAFPFQLPAAPGPHENQALAVNTKDGGIKYTVAYSLVTVQNGASVDQANTAYAFASCTRCATVAVSFQLVLVVGVSHVIAPINFAGALNVNCLACVTVAIADQIVVTLKSQPSHELVAKLNRELAQLNVVSQLGGSPDAIANEVGHVQQEIQTELDQSGLLANPPPSSSSPSSSSTLTSTGTTTAPTQTTTSPSSGSGTGTSTSDTTTSPTGTTTSPSGSSTDTSTSTTSGTDTSTSTSTSPSTTPDSTTSTSTTPAGP
jgi:putative peptide zinc metalloprotease protein